MNDRSDSGRKKNICVGILAHVDAGKTTLSEGMMFVTGRLRKLGRVDHGNAFLDNFALEKSRGITIFSKQAIFPLGDKEVTLLDTPGHVDFSAEMERTLQVLDYAILVISGSDGVQGHTETLWRLLREYHIPVFIFINKMDQPDTNQDKLMAELKKHLDDSCVSFDKGIGDQECMEEIAMTDEDVLEKYMDAGTISDKIIAALIRERKLFPCFFGSALKLEGVEFFLEGLERFMLLPDYPAEFGAKVFKISRDEQENRLTFLKVTGGTLKVKMPLDGGEKADQIRIYSGLKYQLVEEAAAGSVCAVTGLSKTYAGQGLGGEKRMIAPFLEPVMTCRLILPEGTDVPGALHQLKQLEEEEPQLHIVWNPHLEEIQVQLMGEVQTEILKSMIEERFGLSVQFGEEHVLYKETIQEPVIGVGHYEPLRHYAEVHLKMEPGEPGSGLIYATECSEDELDRNWQRLILTHLQEKDHVGVLTGSPITDMKITLTKGRAHLKHTEGGDFRQATYRAIRQGLESVSSILLEPWYEFRLEVPAEQIGRGMSDIQKMNGTFEAPSLEGEWGVLSGTAPAVSMKDYQKEVWSYTGGRGRLFFSLKGYEPCHNQEEVVERMGYDSDADLDNPSGSVFCSHGAGFFVPWNEVKSHMHLQDEDLWNKNTENENNMTEAERTPPVRMSSYEEDKELEAIFLREFGSGKREKDRYSGYQKKTVYQETESDTKGHSTPTERRKHAKEYVLVDGYNIIFAWDFLKELAAGSLEAARNKLMDILCNYQGFTECILIVVFDAYKVKGNKREVFRYHNIHVVYTEEAETADQYIEKTTHELGRKHRVKVATSDALEQVIVMGQGAQRISASDFLAEVERVNDEIRRINEEKKQNGHNYLFDYMEDEMAGFVEQVRLGKTGFSSGKSQEKKRKSR